MVQQTPGNAGFSVSGIGLIQPLLKSACPHFARLPPYLPEEPTIPQRHRSRLDACSEYSLHCPRFLSEQSVAGLTVNDAYGNHRRQTAKRSRKRSRSPDDDLGFLEILTTVCEMADDFLNRAESLDPLNVDKTLSAVEPTIAGLQRRAG